MQRTSYIYKREDCNVIVNKMPIWFNEVEFNGDKNKGILLFHSQNNYDENWGANAKLELSWEQLEREKFFHAKEVQRTIDMYNSVQMVVNKKENTWINSHEFTIWFGNRRKFIRKSYYVEKAIHGIFYCDMTERLFNVHGNVIDAHYEGFKPYLLNAFSSIICHE